VKEEFSMQDVVNFINEILPDDKKIPEDQYENLLSFIDRINKVLNMPQDKKRENLSLAMVFISTAKEDLEASKLLFDKKLYPSSIFHLQQAAEKTTKAYGLGLFVLEKADLKGPDGIGHKTPLAFVKMINNKWILPFVALMKSLYPNLETDVDELEKIAHKKQLELAKSNKDQIKEVLELNRNLEIKLENVMPSILDRINSVLEMTSSLWEDSREISRRFRFEESRRLYFSLLPLFLLSIFTFPHFNYTRYPDLEMRPQEYNEDLGIVKLATEIQAILENSIEQLDRYLKSD